MLFYFLYFIFSTFLFLFVFILQFFNKKIKILLRDEVSSIEFYIGDIVRSGLVRSYLIAKTKKGIDT